MVISLSFSRKILHRFVELFASTNLLADSTIRKTWDWLILIASIWATFSVPVQVCFNEKIYYSRDVSKLICDIFYIITLSSKLKGEGIASSAGKGGAKRHSKSLACTSVCADSAALMSYDSSLIIVTFI